MINAIGQFIIPVSACLAIWLLARDNRSLRRWGPLAGLVGQPFWFVATISAEQWGMLLVAVWFTWVYLETTYRYWFPPGSNEGSSAAHKK